MTGRTRILTDIFESKAKVLHFRPRSALASAAASFLLSHAQQIRQSDLGQSISSCKKSFISFIWAEFLDDFDHHQSLGLIVLLRHQPAPFFPNV